jgi:hypothetical protein
MDYWNSKQKQRRDERDKVKAEKVAKNPKLAKQVAKQQKVAEKKEELKKSAYPIGMILHLSGAIYVKRMSLTWQHFQGCRQQRITRRLNLCSVLTRLRTLNTKGVIPRHLCAHSRWAAAGRRKRCNNKTEERTKWSLMGRVKNHTM